MSNNHPQISPNARTKKKAIGAALVGVVCVGGILLGSTWANLTQTITDGPTSNHINSDETDAFGFIYHSANQNIDADISLVTDLDEAVTGVDHITNFVVENVGDIPAQFAFYVDPATLPALDADDAIWDETHVEVVLPTLATGHLDADKWVGTLREMLNTAFVSDLVLPPGESAGVTVQIVNPTIYNWSSDKDSTAVSIDFGTNFTFNQLSNPVSSPLYAYAVANGEQRNGVFDADYRGLGTNVSKMTTTYTLPAEEVADITL